MMHIIWCILYAEVAELLRTGFWTKISLIDYVLGNYFTPKRGFWNEKSTLVYGRGFIPNVSYSRDSKMSTLLLSRAMYYKQFLRLKQARVRTETYVYDFDFDDICICAWICVCAINKIICLNLRMCPQISERGSNTGFWAEWNRTLVKVDNYLGLAKDIIRNLRLKSNQNNSKRVPKWFRSGLTVVQIHETAYY